MGPLGSPERRPRDLLEEIPDDGDRGAAGASEGANDYGSIGYGGPTPPDREHTYRFRLFALGATLSLPVGNADADVDALEGAAEGHVLAEDCPEGTYAP